MWKSLPAARVMVCSRPLGSVSWARSPARNGPRRCAAPVGSLDRRRSVNSAPGPARRRATPPPRGPPRPGRSTRYSLDGMGLDRGEQVGAGQATGRIRPGSSERDTEDTGTQGRRSSGVATTAASLTSPTGRPSPATTTTALAPACAGPADRLGQRHVGGHGQGRAQQSVHGEVGQPGPQPALRHRLARPRPTRRRRSGPPTPSRSDRARRPRPSASNSGRAKTSTATTRPAQPAATIPAVRRPVARHTPAASTRPPSRGSPGSRLKTATRRWTGTAARPGRRRWCPARARRSGRIRRRRTPATAGARRWRRRTPARVSRVPARSPRHRRAGAG